VIRTLAAVLLLATSGGWTSLRHEDGAVSTTDDALPTDTAAADDAPTTADAPPAHAAPPPTVATGTDADADAADAAPAARATLVPELTSGPVRLKLFGSLRPTFGIVHRDTSSPRDRWGYGATGSRIDLGLDARVGGNVSALLYVTVGAGTAEPDDTGTTRTTATVGLERALMKWEPVRDLAISVGRDAVPLSAQSATPTTGRVFPDRIALDSTFVIPADVGAQATYTSTYVTTAAGVWNGIAGDAMLAPGSSERGLLYSTRVELTPLGKLPFDEHTRDTRLRLGIGGAATYRAATEFSPTGAAGMRTRDLRAGLSVRVAWDGLFVQTELLRKQVTDDLSSRPDVATGGYVQGSYRLRAGPAQVAPLLRAGIERVRQVSAPTTGSSVEAGAAVIPFASDRLVVVGLWSRIHEPDLDPEQRVTGQLRLQF